jgi:hypothetical protein
MAKPGRKPLTPDEHRRRGTYKPYRHAQAETAPVETVEHLEWLDGLPLAARRLGRVMLRDGVVDDERFREYLHAFAFAQAIPRTSAIRDIERLTVANAQVASLLGNLKWR